MAKIYDNKDDYIKDKLTEQATGLRFQAHRQESLGSTFIIGSFLADWWNHSKKNSSKALDWASGLLAIGAIVEWVQAWRTGSRAHDLELQRDRMGPTKVVVLDEQGQAHLEAGAKCTPCSGKPFAADMTRRSHADFAEKAMDQAPER